MWRGVAPQLCNCNKAARIEGEMFAPAQDMFHAAARWRTWVLMGNQDIQLRYRRSVIGPFWISLSLAALIFALTILYSQIFDQPFGDYLRWLSSGFLVWFLLSSMLIEGCSIGTEAEAQLRSAAIPITVLAARMVYRNSIVFLHNALVVVALALIFGFVPTVQTLWIFPGVATVLIIGFLVANIVGPICLRFRDLQQVVVNVVQIIFFLTPVLWRPEQGRVSSVFVEYNPFYHMVELVRAPLLGNVPTEQNWIIVLSVMGVLLVFSVITLSVSRKKIFLWL